MIKKRRFRKVRRVLIVLVVFAIIAFGISQLEVSQFKIPSFGEKEEDIAATVNDEVITKSEIMRVYNSLPPIYKATTSPQAILNNTIEEVLLVQEAEKEGIFVSDRQVKSEVQSYIISLGLVDTEFFEEYLPNKNISSEEFNNSVRDQMLITLLLNEKLYQYIIVSEKELKDYYDLEYGGSNVSFESVEPYIDYVLFNEKAAAAYQLYISQLKKKADIKIYN